MLKFFSGFFLSLALAYAVIWYAVNYGYIQSRTCVFGDDLYEYAVFVNPNQKPKAGENNGDISYVKNRVSGGIVEVYSSKFVDGTVEIRWDINTKIGFKEFRNHGGGIVSQVTGYCDIPFTL